MECRRSLHHSFHFLQTVEGWWSFFGKYVTLCSIQFIFICIAHHHDYCFLDGHDRLLNTTQPAIDRVRKTCPKTLFKKRKNLRENYRIIPQHGMDRPATCVAQANNADTYWDMRKLWHRNHNGGWVHHPRISRSRSNSNSRQEVETAKKLYFTNCWTFDHDGLVVVLLVFFSGKKSVDMMKTWTPFEHIRCAMSLIAARTTGSAPSISAVVELSASMSRWSSQCVTATQSPMCLAPARRPLTCTTMNLTQTRPLDRLLLGWRTLG